MQEIAWGNVLVTLMLPLLAVVWMFFVVKRKSVLQPATETPGAGTQISAWGFGFVITWLAATYLGLYLAGMMQMEEAAVTGADKSLGALVTWAGLYTSALWGALVPYRMLARQGKRSVALWLGIALAYMLLFFVATLFVR